MCLTCIRAITVIVFPGDPVAQEEVMAEMRAMREPNPGKNRVH